MQLPVIIGIGFVLVVGIFIVTNLILAKRLIDLLDANAFDMVKNFGYNSLKIKRKRSPLRLNFLPASHTEYTLEAELPTPWSVLPSDDIIEVHGIKGAKEYLVFKIEWSKEYAQQIKQIVDNINHQLIH